jgi:ABC-type lipoprotein export system ATPase subunit
VISAKQKIEICLFFYSAVGLLLGTTSLFQALLLFQNVSLKCKFNGSMKQAQQEAALWFERSVSHNQALPDLLRKALELVWRGYTKLLNML